MANNGPFLPGSYTIKGIINIWKAAGGKNDTNMIVAVAIAEASSGGNTGKIANKGDPDSPVGLWQLKPSQAHLTRAQLLDPLTNAKAAFTLSQSGKTWKAFPAAYGKPADATTYGNDQAPYKAQLRAVDLANGGTGSVDDNLFDPLGQAARVTGLDKAVDPLVAVGQALKVIAQAVAKAAGWLANPHNWLRIVEVVAGLIAAVLGVRILAGSGSTLGRGASRAAGSPLRLARKVIR